MAASEEERRKGEKPVIDEALALKLVPTLFDLRPVADSIRQLDSYDDVNFYVKGYYGSHTELQEFTVKIHNGVDSANAPFIEAQNMALLHLSAQSLSCPVPKRAKTGGFTASIQLPAKRGDGSTVQHAVRLLSWVPGDIMNHASITHDLLLNTGRFVGRLGNALAGFDHPGLHRVHMWDLACTPEVERFVPMINDSEVEAVVREVLADFRERVVPVIPTLRTSVVQGDLNDANMLVDARGKDISGVIDFGDSLYGCTVFDLAICMAYVMLRPAPGLSEVQTAAAVLQGYAEVAVVEETELALLPTLVAARLAQSVSMGAFSLAQDPTNEYLKLHAQPARMGLKAFWRTERRVIDSLFAYAVNPKASDLHHVFKRPFHSVK